MVLKTIKRMDGMTEFTNIFRAFNMSPVFESTLKKFLMFNKVARTIMNKMVQ